MSGPRTDHGVLVGVDGSPASDAAVRWAAREAAMRSTALTVVHVFAEPVMSLAQMRTQVNIRAWQKVQGNRIIANAIKIAQSSADKGEPAQINSELYFSVPVPTLVNLSNEAVMVVVGCRGRGALGRALLGSVSTGLAHHANCPVAIIHDEAPLSAVAPVLVGIDGSPVSELATAIAFDEASWRGVELVALHAFDDADVSHLPRIEWSAIQSVAQETLAERLAGWSERYPDVAVHRLVVWDHPARHLLEQSASAQLVVVGSHGRGGFAGTLLGSVSTAVVQAARTPVILARPH